MTLPMTSRGKALIPQSRDRSLAAFQAAGLFWGDTHRAEALCFVRTAFQAAGVFWGAIHRAEALCFVRAAFQAAGFVLGDTQG